MRKMMRTVLSTAILSVAALAASAPAHADVNSVKTALFKKFPKLNPKSPVRTTSIPGVYEVNLAGTAAYTDEKVSFFLLNGHLIDAATLNDWTDSRAMAITKAGFDMLPLNLALKTVYGKGQRTLVTFEDPDCPFCREEHSQVFESNPEELNATVYTFLLPLTGIHPDAMKHSLAILCASDPNTAWRKWMSTPQPMMLNLPPESNCQAGQERLEAMRNEGLDRGFNATPSMMFESGQSSRLGFLRMDQLNVGFGLSNQFLEQLKKEGSSSTKTEASKAEAKDTSLPHKK